MRTCDLTKIRLGWIKRPAVQPDEVECRKLTDLVIEYERIMKLIREEMKGDYKGEGMVVYSLEDFQKVRALLRRANYAIRHDKTEVRDSLSHLSQVRVSIRIDVPKFMEPARDSMKARGLITWIKGLLFK